MTKIRASIIAALPEEVANIGAEHPVTISGVGKVNAAIAASRLLHADPSIQLIINIGTAGSSQLPVGSVHSIGSYRDRDYVDHGISLGNFFEPIDFAEELDSIAVAYERSIAISTGDTFVTSINDFHIVDMEAYSIARVGRRHNVPVLSVKYISDGCDLASAETWRPALNRAQEKLSEYFFALRHRFQIV